MESPFLFVCGTLRRGAKRFGLMAALGDFVDRATVQGRLYRVARYPGLVLCDTPEERVVGEVFRLRNPRIALARLDRYEQCGPGFAKPTEYVRDHAAVRCANGKRLTAWLYVYNRRTDGLTRLRGGDFLAPRRTNPPSPPSDSS